MATGDQSDVLARIKSTLPRWFPSTSPTLDNILSGFAWAGSFVYSLYAYAKLQTRIKTATDGWMDMIAADFFGTSLLRAQGQSDASFLARIIANMFRERATRKSITRVLTDLTGRAPLIFEPLRPMDTGAYGLVYGYGAAGAYGSMLLPYQAFVDAYRQAGSGVPLVAGYGISTGGYSTPSRADYASIGSVTSAISDADIYAAVDSVKPAGTIIWTRINP